MAKRYVIFITEEKRTYFLSANNKIFILAPEAIMEPGVTEALRVYLEEGSGSTETAIEAVVTGYNAYAQVAPVQTGNSYCENISYFAVGEPYV